MSKRKIQKNLSYCWYKKEQVKRKTYSILTSVQEITCDFKNMFVDLAKSDHVTFEDVSKISVKRKDKILIRLKNGRHQFILNVYFMPNMKNNILSLSQLLEKVYDIHMKNQSLSKISTNQFNC